MMWRLLALIVAALPVGMGAGPAQAQSSKVPRVAYVWIFTEGPSAPYADAFRERMRENGWIEVIQ